MVGPGPLFTFPVPEAHRTGLMFRIFLQVHLRWYWHGSMRDGVCRDAHSFQCAFSRLRFGGYSLRGVAFAQLDQRLHAHVAIRHRRLCDTGHFHDMAVVSWVGTVSFLSLADDLTVATSKDKIIWECENGGQLWGESAEAGYGNSSSFPNAVCGPGWNSLFTAFIVCLLVDLGFQVRKQVFPRRAGLLTSPIFHSSWDPDCDRRCTPSSSTGASRDG